MNAILEIRLNDLSSAAIRTLLGEHLRNTRSISLPESVRAMDVERPAGQILQRLWP